MRPAWVWTAYAACLAVVIGAMAWSTQVVLGVERAEQEARARAALEENVRLALWRMDSVVMPLLARESSRAAETSGTTGAPEAAHVRLRFRLGRDGAPMLTPVAGRPGAAQGDMLQRLRGVMPALDVLVAAARAPEPPPAPAPAVPSPLPVKVLDAAPVQKRKSEREFEVRHQALVSNRTVHVPPSAPRGPGAGAGREQPGGPRVGPVTALWAGGELLLVRNVIAEGRAHIEGAWLDWPALRDELLASARDLLPAATLVPSNGRPDGAERLLVTLPVRLQPGAAAALPSGRGPAALSLLAAWALLALAAASVAALLAGVMSLSERRRVFVSAVTHELRTPLTTFRLYADMLAEGMVSGEEKRREYLARLQAEARRLGHLVENVLFYSRLDGGRAGGHREDVDLAAFVGEQGPRLDEIAGRAELRLLTSIDAHGPMTARVDRAALEQVLVNLVDNACRYASGSEPPVIHLAVSRRGREAVVTVRDHGPGLSASVRRRLFEPFSKSDHEAADSAPGVGLGLALSRRLARAQGGDLRLDETVRDGAAFELVLPLARGPAGTDAGAREHVSGVPSR